jgi:hypothetical protein
VKAIYGEFWVKRQICIKTPAKVKSLVDSEQRIMNGAIIFVRIQPSGFAQTESGRGQDSLGPGKLSKFAPAKRLGISNAGEDFRKRDACIYL